MFTFTFDLDKLFAKEQNEQQSRKIVDMHRQEFIHQRRIAQPINYENTTT